MIKVSLTFAQLAALRYAGRGELTGDLADEVYATGTTFPKTVQARALARLGLIAEQRAPGERTKLVLTNKGAAVLAAADA